jgi:hypothetical protein
MEARAHRPIAISVLAILAFVQAFFALIGGLALIAEHNDDNLLAHVDQSSDELLWIGIIGLIVGAIAFLIGLGLWRGSEVARTALAVVQVLYIAGGVYHLFAWGGTYLWSGLFQILWALLVLWLLYGLRDDEAFFRGTRTA